MQIGQTAIEPQLPATYPWKLEPYNHQVAAHNWARDKEFFALFMEQGTGKTKTIIDLAGDLFLRGEITAVMVVAPNGVHRQWARKELPKHGAVPYSYAVFKSTLSKGHRQLLNDWVPKKINQLKWLMVNVESFSHDTHIELFKKFLKENKTFLVIDEATAIKNPSAKRTIALLSWLGDATYRGKSLIGYTPYAVKRAILTGTPVTNSVYDLWSMFYFLKPHFFVRSYYAFRGHYGIETQMEIFVGGYARKIKKLATRKDIAKVRRLLENGSPFLEVADKMGMTTSDVQYLIDNPDCDVPYKHLGELKKEIAPYSFFVRKSECYDLPPKVYEVVSVPMSAQQKLHYESLKKHYMTIFHDKEVTVTQKVALYIRLSQIAGGFLPYEDDSGAVAPRAIEECGPKLDALLSKLGDAAFPVIVTTRFRAEAQMLHRALTKAYPDERVELVLGGVSGRDKVMEDYTTGLVGILVANERIISKGFNLQNGNVIHRYSQGYSIEDSEQLEDRIHRDGQQGDKCVYVSYLTEGTIDEEIYASVRNGKDLLEFMRDTSVTEFLSRKEVDVQFEFNFGGKDSE